MKTLLLLALMAATLLAGEPKPAPKLSDALLKNRWKAMAIYHSSEARAMVARAEMEKAAADYRAAIEALKEACGKGYTISEAGEEVTCVEANK